MKPTFTRVQPLRTSEDGSLTVFGLFMFLCMLMVAGLALDVANAYRYRTHLQVAADSAAHAALVRREFESASEARAAALDVAEYSLPFARHGDVLREEDIYFGDWDDANQTFSVSSSSKQAVMVDTGRAQDRGNSVGTYLLKFVGLGAWDVRRQSIFTVYKPTCLREGFVGEDVVSTTSGNHYLSGFCIHSNTHVSFNSFNTFDDGVIVSMPDRADLVLPTDGFATNEGLKAALRDGSYQLRILQRVQDIIAGVRDPYSVYFRDWIDSSASEINLVYQEKPWVASQFTAARIHTHWCTSSSQTMAIKESTILSDMVIVTNCQVKFGENVGLENVTFVNTNTSSKSFYSASGIRLGRDDNCASDGGAQLVTMGGVSFPQYMKMFGAQILALGDVSFTADANGIQGASIVSGGRIDGTTDSVMGFCGGLGAEDNFEAWYFRLAL